LNILPSSLADTLISVDAHRLEVLLSLGIASYEILQLCQSAGETSAHDDSLFINGVEERDPWNFVLVGDIVTPLEDRKAETLTDPQFSILLFRTI